jgi:hypothetical protein
MIKKLLLLAGMAAAFVTVLSADYPLPPCPPSCDFVSAGR